MTTVDFTAWVAPELVIPLGGRTYTVPPPSVDRARTILALVVRSEVALGLHPGPVPAELEELLVVLDEAKTPLGVVSLGQGVYSQLVDDGVASVTIDRLSYYALHFWARGKGRADAIATALWTPRPEDQAPEDDAPGESAGR